MYEMFYIILYSILANREIPLNFKFSPSKEKSLGVKILQSVSLSRTPV